MRSRLDRAVNIAVIVAATVVSLAAVYKTVLAPAGLRVVSSPDDVTEPVLVGDSLWKEMLGTGVLQGNREAKITIVEFGDLECPFCSRFHEALQPTKQKYGDDLAFVFVHYPLAMHRFASPAARAAECADQAGAFGRYTDLLFSKQDSFGLKTWASFAIDAGVTDTLTFNNCIITDEAFPRIEAGRQLGRSANVNSTPTIFINGWQLPRVPYDELSLIIEDILAGRGDFK